MSFVIILICSVYSVMLLVLAVAWLSAHFQISTSAPAIQVSVLIPFRNEIENLPKLIACIKAQDFVSPRIEYIFIDDHSDDGSSDLVRKHDEFRLISSADGEGKKHAIHLGIQHASHEWIVTIDADVTFGPKWIETIGNGIRTLQSDMIILPLAIREEPGFLGKIQCLEFLGIVGVTAGSAILKNPVLCNGGNLAFKKSAYREAHQLRQDMSISSGDDMFLLHAMKKNHRISWLHHRDALATVAPCHSLSDLIHQRVRWASKGRQYEDNATTIFGALVVITNALLLLHCLLTIFHLTTIESFFTVLFNKLAADFLLTLCAARWLRQLHLMFLFPVLFALYPFYLLIVGAGSIFFKPKWKGRRISLSHPNVSRT